MNWMATQNLQMTMAGNMMFDMAEAEKEKSLQELTDEELTDLYEDDHDCGTPNGDGCGVCAEMVARNLLPDYDTSSDEVHNFEGSL